MCLSAASPALNLFYNKEERKMEWFLGFQLKVRKTILKIDKIHHTKMLIKL